MPLPTVAFVGTGVMGARMAGHLLAAGHPLRVHNRTRAKADTLVERGAVWSATPADAARGADLVCTMLGEPADVRAVYDALLPAAEPGALLIDFTTSSPALARDLSADAARRGLDLLDAPVSGGDRGAREATLSIMVGGTPAAFARARTTLDLLGKNVVHHGPPGSGQLCKLANQIAVAGSTLGACEALAFAGATGLDPNAVLQSIAGGASGSWTLANLAPRMLAGDDAPGFYVRHFAKDLRLIRDAADAAEFDAPTAGLARHLYEQLEAHGLGTRGTQALYRFLSEGPRTKDD